VSIEKGTLYVVATPIGNLTDLSSRARDVLASVDVIAAEDTRHTRGLLSHFGIERALVSLHEHNERRVLDDLVQRLRAGESVAQVSDAGTPLVSDPGFHLVRAAQDAGIRVVPVPGPSAVLAALAAAGVPTDRFVFEGFLPSKEGARRKRLQELAAEPRTLVFFEAPHRIAETLADLAAIFGAHREAAVARELTKTFETIRRAPLAELAAWVNEDANQRRGELVLVVHGAPETEGELDAEALRVLKLLAAELPPRQAAALAAEITGKKKNLLYQALLSLSDETKRGGRGGAEDAEST
jgi:16S rRNA (cytidine1402-2'-O)-methyltransferase